MRLPLRAGCALPRVGVFLSRNRKCQCRLLAQVQGDAAARIDMLRLRRARDRSHRAAWWADGVWGRSHRRRLSALRTASRRQREELRSGLRRGGGVSGLDVCSAGLCRFFGGLLSQESHHASGAQAVLHFGSGEIAVGVSRVAKGEMHACDCRAHVRCQLAPLRTGRADGAFQPVPPTVMRSMRRVG